MSFKNVANGKYLGTVSGVQGNVLTLIDVVDGRSLWKWRGNYLAPKININLFIDVYRTAHDRGNQSGRMVLWPHGWKDWQCQFTLVPAVY